MTQVEGVRLSSGAGTGLGLKFDSLKDRVFVPYSDPFEYRGGDLTISFWANPASSETSGGNMVSKPWNANGEYNYRVGFRTNRTVWVALGGATGWSGGTGKKLSPDTWHHIVVSLVGSTSNVKIYLDGELTKEATYTIANWAPTHGDTN